MHVHLYTSNSMNACADWLGNPVVRRQLGLSARDDVSQRTLNRALEILCAQHGVNLRVKVPLVHIAGPIAESKVLSARRGLKEEGGEIPWR